MSDCRVTNVWRNISSSGVIDGTCRPLGQCYLETYKTKADVQTLCTTPSVCCLDKQPDPFPCDDSNEMISKVEKILFLKKKFLKQSQILVFVLINRIVNKPKVQQFPTFVNVSVLFVNYFENNKWKIQKQKRKTKKKFADFFGLFLPHQFGPPMSYVVVIYHHLLQLQLQHQLQ